MDGPSLKRNTTIVACEDSVTRTLAMGEWVPTEEIGELIAFLATGKVRDLTGATLDVNGATDIR